jgi:hypothetical protein
MTLLTAIIIYIAIGAIIAVLSYGGDDEMNTDIKAQSSADRQADLVRRVAQQTEWGVDAHYDGVKPMYERYLTYANQSERIGDYIETYTGVKFYPLDPRAEDVDVADMTHAISHLCRFGGHCSVFYSVGQHSLLTAQYLRDQGASAFVQFLGLTHDFTEAYVVDMPSPLKRQLPEYIAVENAIESVIWESFGLRTPTDEEYAEVKAADVFAVNLEARLLNVNKTEWASDIGEWYPYIFKHLTEETRPSIVKADLQCEFNRLFAVLIYGGDYA